MDNITVSDYIAKFLHKQGVTHVYEVVGGMITFLLDSIATEEQIQLVSVHHEQGAAFAADAYGRIKKVPGVAMATSGPGATNLITGIGSCYFDSVPAVFITGQVNTHEQKGESQVRQLGFQETNIVEMVKSITKAAWLINDPNEIPDRLEQAFKLSITGRPGPVLLDIPMNVQRSIISSSPQKIEQNDQHELNLAPSLSELQLALEQSSSPLIIAGGGIHSSNSQKEFEQLIDLINIPVISSLMAIDLLDYHSDNRIGFLGSYGNRWVNKALGQSDLLIVLGSRLDIRQTGADIPGFQRGKKIFHIDIDPSEMNNRLKDCIEIQCDLNYFITTAIKHFSRNPIHQKSTWKNTIKELKKDFPDTKEIQGIEGINPNIFMHKLSQASICAAGYTVDVGQHQMWAAQSLEINLNQRMITSGGMGAMGYALPAAIGFSHACPGQTVISISGDGGFQLNLQELETIAHHQLPIKIVIINNQCHGMVRQFQQSYFKERYVSTKDGYSTPNFENIALAYGIPSSSVSEESYLEEALLQLWEKPLEPYLLQVNINFKNNAYPKIAFGQPMTEMEPEAKPLDMEGT